jgi:hypothetical protein
MHEIVHAHLPGVPLIHLPTPPPQIRAITDHVYFFFDRQSPLWPEFSIASSIGMHFSGDWPDLELELWSTWRARELQVRAASFGGSGDRTVIRPNPRLPPGRALTSPNSRSCLYPVRPQDYVGQQQRSHRRRRPISVRMRWSKSG